MDLPRTILCSNTKCANNPFRIAVDPVVLQCGHIFCSSCISFTPPCVPQCMTCALLYDPDAVVVSSSMKEVCDWFIKTLLEEHDAALMRTNKREGQKVPTILSRLAIRSPDLLNGKNCLNGNNNNSGSNNKGSSRSRSPPVPAKEANRFAIPAYMTYMKGTKNAKAPDEDKKERSKTIVGEAPNWKDIPYLDASWECKSTVHSTLHWLKESPNPLIQSKEGWHVEQPRNFTGKIDFEDKYMDVCCYSDNFCGKDHSLFLGTYAENFPIFVAVEKTTNNVPKKALVRTKDGDQRIWIKNSALKEVYQSLKAQLSLKADIWEVKNQEALSKDMCMWEDMGRCKTFKFGVMYCKEGQAAEGDMLSNVLGSPEYDSFLDLLGVRVKLKDWGKFTGGLCVKNDLDGSASVYTQFHHYEIMFHVSTLLSFRSDDPQQIDRKRHIGNDIIVLVFMEKGAVLSPGFLKTQFNHVYFVVQPTITETGAPKYKLAVAAKEGVPPFGPMLPNVPEFERGSTFKEFLLTKMINAERAALHAPNFVERISNHRQAYLQSLLTRYSEKL